MDQVVSLLSRSEGIRDQFTEDPWTSFCNGYFAIYIFLN